MNTNTLRILTLNCQRGFLLSDLAPYLEQLIRESSYDLIALQEVDGKVQSVIRQILKKQFTYQLVETKGLINEGNIEVSVIYKLSSFHYESTEYISFNQHLNKKGNPIGALLCYFQGASSSEQIALCSLHLPAKLHRKARMNSLNYLKTALVSSVNNASVCVLAGDFNTILPGELSVMKKILDPEFQYISDYHSYTSDSGLLEPKGASNRLLRLLGKIGIRFKLKLDHIFISGNTILKGKPTCEVIPVAVSDHRPVSVEFSYVQD